MSLVLERRTHAAGVLLLDQQERPCVDRYGKPTGSALNLARLASVDDNKEAALDPNLIWHMNGYVRSVQNKEDKEDFISA